MKPVSHREPARIVAAGSGVRRLLAPLAASPRCSYRQPARPAPQDPGAADNGRTIEAIEFRGAKSSPKRRCATTWASSRASRSTRQPSTRTSSSSGTATWSTTSRWRAIPTAAGVRLVITVAERPVLRSIDYEGLKRISKTDLQDKLTTQRIRVREGEPLSLGELQRVKTLIEEMYGEKGYRFATGPVHDRGRRAQREAGDLHRGRGEPGPDLGHRFRGQYGVQRPAPALGHEEHQGDRAHQPDPKKDIYDPGKLQEDLDKVRDVYRARPVQVEDVGPNEKKVVFTVDEGNRVRISDIEFEGNTVFNDLRLRWSMKKTKETQPHHPLLQEGHLRSGEAPGGPRQGPRPLPRPGLQERGHRRSQGRGAGAEPERGRAPRTRSAGCSSPSRSRRGSAGSSAR